FHMRRCIKIAVKVTGIVQDTDVHVFSWLPLNKREESFGIAFQNPTVFVYALQNGSGYRKYNTWRIKAPLRQNMMDEIAMDTTIPIPEWVDIDKSEGKDTCCQNSIHFTRILRVKIDQALYKA